MKTTLTFIFLFFQLYARSQEGNWEVYLTQYEKGLGSTSFNTDLIKNAPNRELQFLVITGVTCNQCKKDGFPQKEEFDALYEMEDNVVKVISEAFNFELAGTFTYQCQRLNMSTLRTQLV